MLFHDSFSLDSKKHPWRTTVQGSELRYDEDWCDTLVHIGEETVQCVMEGNAKLCDGLNVIA
jgi:hypothetical protein